MLIRHHPANAASRLALSGAFLLAFTSSWAQTPPVQTPPLAPIPASAPGAATGPASAPAFLPAPRPVSALELCFKRPPSYPAVALRDGLEGRSVVGFRITAERTLEDTALFRSSGHGSLDQAALAHLERCRASALQRDNPFPPNGHYYLPISWRIEP